jgi:hypothetical protein
MPEAPMNEDYKPMPGQYYIGPARKVLAMQTETQAIGVEHPPDRPFGLSARRAYARHEGASFGINVQHRVHYWMPKG